MKDWRLWLTICIFIALPCGASYYLGRRAVPDPDSGLIAQIEQLQVERDRLKATVAVLEEQRDDALAERDAILAGLVLPPSYEEWRKGE